VADEVKMIFNKRTRISMIISLVLVLLSLFIIINEGVMSGSAWALILLIPFTIITGLPPLFTSIEVIPYPDNGEEINDNSYEFDDEQIDEEVDYDAEPLEEGFDIPIL